MRRAAKMTSPATRFDERTLDDPLSCCSFSDVLIDGSETERRIWIMLHRFGIELILPVSKWPCPDPEASLSRSSSFRSSSSVFWPLNKEESPLPEPPRASSACILSGIVENWLRINWKKQNITIHGPDVLRYWFVKDDKFSPDSFAWVDRSFCWRWCRPTSLASTT